ncbi:MAG: DUF499 domain-containing protein [Methylovulum sp.]|nr:DUF499 domain-containing protein [Methylovulum sp.]
MIKTVKQACVFNPIIRDYRMSQAIENLADLIKDEGDGQEFFARNYITQGMDQLFREGMLRLSGQSDQAVFELTQAMGGGKTHMMIAFGLLARHPELRQQILPTDLSGRINFGKARIAAFNGRNNPDNFIWGEIATQLGQEEAIKPHWINGPKAVDQAQWKAIIGNEPTLIMLDELPPYLDNATTQVIGQGTLANMVTYSLGCLLSAALELDNCCIVIANLSGSYTSQSKALAATIDNLQQETRRQAKTITPVQLAGNEIYEILKKRLILTLPDDSVINDVAEEYAQRIKAATDGGYITASSIEQIAEQVRETYPFHPAFKHLVALFKENEGFRQTRGLMQFTARLLKSVEDRQLDDVFLIGSQHLNLNDLDVKDEISRIAPSLQPAMSHDIADGGNAVAESIDDQLSSDAATQVITLLLASSLSRAVGGRTGLSEGEIIEFLAAPNRKSDEFVIALEKLREQAWYLHREDQRYFIKETENLSRKIERNARDIPPPKIEQALINRLTGILQPVSKAAYQELKVLPLFDDIRLIGPRLLIVVRPDGKLPPQQLNNFFMFQQEKNNLAVLSGQDSHFADAVEERLRELYAIEQIVKQLREGDTLYQEARERLEDAEQRFMKALSAAYNRVYFPGVDETTGEEVLLMVTIDNGLKVGAGEQSAEKQIEELLASPRANYKLALDVKNDINNYLAQAEVCLWPERDRRTPWKDVLMRAKTNPEWPWMPGSAGMDMLKTEALKQGRWRQGEDGYIEKGPFPKDKTTLNITPQSTNKDSGESTLTLTPRNCGDSAVIHYSQNPSVSTSDPVVEDLDNFTTSASTLYFLAVDREGKHEIGEPKRWIADLMIRHQLHVVADKRKIELKCVPSAEIYYTLNGSNPKEGSRYEAPFEVGAEAYRLLVFAKAGEATKNTEFSIPASGDQRFTCDDRKPARLLESKRVNLDSTEKVFAVLNRFRDRTDTLLKGVRIQIGEGENTVQIRFHERQVTAQMIEETVNTLRKILGDDQAQISIDIVGGIQFGDGYAAKEFAELSGLQLKPGDILQED